MDLTRLYGAAEIVVPLLVFAAYSLRKFRSGMEATWKEEAEAYRSKVERQSEELAALHKEVRELRRENAELRAQIDRLLARP
jgi:septal ring factor EnvC (AmiA/AmiB activator)